MGVHCVVRSILMVPFDSKLAEKIFGYDWRYSSSIYDLAVPRANVRDSLIRVLPPIFCYILVGSFVLDVGDAVDLLGDELRIGIFT